MSGHNEPWCHECGRGFDDADGARKRLGRLHRPKVYRYRVASCVTGFRVAWNRYPGQVIGAYVVVGRFAYCVKWGWATGMGDEA